MRPKHLKLVLEFFKATLSYKDTNEIALHADTFSLPISLQIQDNM